jgi:hypothetical protein
MIYVNINGRVDATNGHSYLARSKNLSRIISGASVFEKLSRFTFAYAVRFKRARSRTWRSEYVAGHGAFMLRYVDHSEAQVAFRVLR